MGYDASFFEKEIGAYFFRCSKNKNPEYGVLWQDPKNHLDPFEAVCLATEGNFIGMGMTPPYMVVDIDNKPDWQQVIKNIEDAVGEKFPETLTVKTLNGGRHLYFKSKYSHEFSQGVNIDGIEGFDTRLPGKGYVIAPFCDGYEIEIETDIADLPNNFEIFLKSLSDAKKTSLGGEVGTVPIEVIREILNNMDAREYGENDKWFSFVCSVISAGGNTPEVLDAILDWSDTDVRYRGKRSDNFKRIRNIAPSGGITTGTFIHEAVKNCKSKEAIKKIPQKKMKESVPVSIEREEDDISQPFKILGQCGDIGYFAIMENKNIVKCSLNNVKKDFLTSLATQDEYWSKKYGRIKNNKSGEPEIFVAWDEAIDAIKSGVRRSKRIDNPIIRKGGIFYDSGRMVYHNGDHLIVDGEKIGLFDIDIKDSFYIGAQPIDKSDIDLATDEELNELWKFFESLKFERDEEKKYFSGFCIFSRFMPYLYWKSNIWVTAPAGRGKTTILESVMMPLIGKGHKKGVYKWGSPSEAAVRQLRDGYSWPVIVEEAEQRGIGDSAIQKLLMMIRNTSGYNCFIPRGTSNGEGMEFEFPNAICFSSTAATLIDQADKDRTSICNYIGVDGNDWNILKRKIKELLTPEYCERVRNRIESDFEIIQKNIELLKEIMEESMTSRSVDQIAGLIGPSNYLLLPREWTVDECRSMVGCLDFSKDIEHKDDTEEDACFRHMMRFRFTISRGGDRQEVSIQDCLERLTSRVDIGGINIFTPEIIQKELERFYIKIETRHTEKSKKVMRLYKIKDNEIFKRTKWENSFLSVIARHESCKTEYCSNNPVKAFPGMQRVRYIGFDTDLIFSDSKAALSGVIVDNREAI